MPMHRIDLSLSSMHPLRLCRDKALRFALLPGCHCQSTESGDSLALLTQAVLLLHGKQYTQLLRYMMTLISWLACRD